MPTPTPSPEHPANRLSKLLSEDLKFQLLKTPYILPLEAEIYESRLKDIRDNWKYGFIVQWCYLFKNLIKLTDHFDVDTFEEELLLLNPPTFITRLKVQLIHYLTGTRISDSYLEETGEFEEALKSIIPQYLLEKFKTDDELENFQFFKLSPAEQIEIYYELIELANVKNESLRKFVDTKFDKTIESLKPISILSFNNKNKQEEYLILPDLRLYFKELTFKKINIPRKKSELEAKPIEKWLQDLEPVVSKFTCIATSIYEYDAFINEQPRTSLLYKSLKLHYDEIAENDVKRRKQELSRQRQIKLQSLMVHRKRSSRLEEKEKRKLEEDERDKLEFEQMRREAAANRAAKRMKLRGDEFDSREGSVSMESRDERYRRKHLETGYDSSAATQSPDPSSEIDHPLLIEDSSEPATNLNLGNSLPVDEQFQETVLVPDVVPAPISEVTHAQITSTPVPDVPQLTTPLVAADNIPEVTQIPTPLVAEVPTPLVTEKTPSGGATST